VSARDTTEAAMTERRRGLGRGLGALIPDGPGSGTHRPVDVFFPQQAGERGQQAGEQGHQARQAGGVEPNEPAEAAPAPARDESHADVISHQVDLVAVPGVHLAEISVAAIRRNERQPRHVFDTEELEELASSISEVGMLQTVVVRPVEASREPEYELVMGERRWRAAQLAGLATVPAIVRLTHDGNMLRDALLENLHRVQLSPLEEAAAYQQLLEDFACTHEELATRLARSRPQISNTIRLLRLPPTVQRALATGALSSGHARALLGLGAADAMERLAQRIVAEGLSVRQTEEIVASRTPAGHRPPSRPAAAVADPRLDELAARLSDQLDARVRISLGQRRGRIAIEFGSVEDLDRILGTLAPGAEPAALAGATTNS
jgi:ParB family chromosome partitioning protein